MSLYVCAFYDGAFYLLQHIYYNQKAPSQVWTLALPLSPT